MKKENILRLKKYLFYISLFFVLLLGTHITYIYLHKWAHQSPVVWWAISEWIIWTFPPHINPLIQSNDYHNTRIIDKLYRSLVRYNENEAKFVWDLANCDLSRLDFVECYLKDDLKWSNGEDLTTKDVVDTFNMIKNQNTNPTIAKILEETTIEVWDNIISFSRSNKDLSVLALLNQPIVSSNLLNSIWTREIHWSFSPINWIYSWKYVIEWISTDESSWVDNLNLSINKYNNSDVFIQRYIFKFFNDRNHLSRNKESINVFFDTQSIIWDSMPRLKKRNISLNQFVSIFINQDKITDNELRNFILNKIDREQIISSLWRGYNPVNNPYLSEVKIDNELINPNIVKILEKKWYYKKDSINNKSTIPNSNISKNIDDLNKTLEIIQSPINKKYNFISEDNILIEWIVSMQWVESVSINDYTLNWYSKGNEKFYYRIRESFNNISEWNNLYKVYFHINWEKKLVEEFNVIYYKDINKLKSSKTEIENKLKEEYIKANPNLRDEIQKEVESLDDNYFYNNNLESFSLKLAYIEWQKDYNTVVENIVKSLWRYWINIIPKAITFWELSNMVNEWNKDYDMILIWLDHWTVTHNLFPYLHSSQASNWYNLANIKNLNLDIILEELNWELINKEKISELTKKAKELISWKNTIKTLYSKETPLLIDRNINNFNIRSNINSIKSINSFFRQSYISTVKTINFEDKWIIDFIKFIINTFKTNE